MAAEVGERGCVKEGACGSNLVERVCGVHTWGFLMRQIVVASSRMGVPLVCCPQVMGLSIANSIKGTKSSLDAASITLDCFKTTKHWGRRGRTDAQIVKVSELTPNMVALCPGVAALGNALFSLAAGHIDHTNHPGRW